jgi:hypothetical protein
MLMTDSYGIVPGLTTARETYENEFRWGSGFQGVFANALISGSATDSGNSPTFELRPGLLLGQQISTGKYLQYSPTATDGTEVAAAILIEGLRMLDFSNIATDRFYAVLVGGPVKATKIFNLDLMARQQMDKFIFDDNFNIPGAHWWPFKRQQTKTASYTIVATDNYSQFNNLGATGTVVFTLPAIANGYFFGFHGEANQTITVTSAEGSNLIGLNSLTSTSASFSTSGQIIGAGFHVYSNAAGTKWIVENSSGGVCAVTLA